MEAKIRIIEVCPKLKCFKNNPKDIISISFVSDNYSVKIEDIEKAITSSDKIIVNLKESNSKNKYQPIKYSLIRNNNNIIATGEFIPSEGIKWYKLNEVKKNMSKESLITSSTSSNGNIKNINNFSNSHRAHNSSDSHNSFGNEPTTNYYSKSNFNKLSNNSSLSIIKIKFSIKLSSKKMFSNNKKYKSNSNLNNNNHYNSTINNNYTKEPSENSSRYYEMLFERDIFNEEEISITELNVSKIRPSKKNSATTSKKFDNQQKFLTGLQSNKFSKKKINFNQNQSPKKPGSPTAEFNSYNSKTIVNTFSNYKAFSRDRKNHNLVSKKNFKEEIRLKNSMGLNKIKNIEEKRDSCENKNISKKNSNDNNNEKIPKIPRKILK